MHRKDLVSSTSSVVNGPPYLIFSKINSRRNVILPVGESTTVFRAGVVPGILKHSVNQFEGMLTSSINVKVSFREDKQAQTNTCTHQL